MPGYIPRALLDQYHADAGEPVDRMSMLPFGTFPNPGGDGYHLGMAVPGMIQEPVNALMRLMGTPSNPGTFTQGPDYPGNADDMRTILESTFGGNALNPAVRVPEGAVASGAFRTAEHLPMDEASRLARAREMGFIAYRGVPEGGSFANADAPMAFLSETPDLASQYAMRHQPYDPSGNPSVYPANVSFKNPLVIDAAGAPHHSIPFEGGEWPTDDIADIARARGHDGVVFQNISDGFGPRTPETVYAAVARNTVSSPLTGETLFSDTSTPSLPGAVIAGAENAPRRVYHGTTSNFDAFGTPTVWTTEDPDVAAIYAHNKFGSGENGSIIPMDLHAQNIISADELDKLLPEGLSRNAKALAANSLGYDAIDYGDGYLNAIRPGTLKSPLTGDTLFSGTSAPSLPGAVIAGAEKGNPSWRDFIATKLSPGESIHHTKDGWFNSRFNHNGTEYIAGGAFPEDNTAHVNWIGPDDLSPSDASGSPFANSLGRDALRQWRDSFLQQFPTIQNFGGLRVSGAKALNNAASKQQTIPALFSDNTGPSLPGMVVAGAEHNLPMDQAARMQRASELGFNIDRTLYRGAPESSLVDGGFAGPEVHLTDDPAYASWYGNGYMGTGTGASPEGGAVFPVFTRGEPLAVTNHADGTSTYRYAPEAIRSRSAVFDPADVNRNGLLLSDSHPSLWGPALQDQQQQYPPNWPFNY